MQCVCEYFFILAKYIFVFDGVAANVGWLPRARFFCKNLRKNLVVSKICCTFAAEFKNNTIMTQKTFKLITAIVGGLETIAVGLVTYFEPAGATAINASILIVGTAIIDVCANFVKQE